MRIYIPVLANLLALGVLLFSLVDRPAVALTNPVIDGTSVTAVVIDRLPPSTPILIAPEDDEKLKSGKVEFVWQESTDNWLMDHYTLVLNDEILFDNIPLTATSSSDYTLEYDILTGYYTLTVDDDLDDGSYSWSITAWDYHGNSTSSVTWSFSIDTKAPEFTITQIEDQEVEIITGDADSVPKQPFILNANQPMLSGTGERNSDVELTIRYPNGTSITMEFEIDGDGEWSVTLDTLPRDGIVYLDFLITDPTGNISILKDVPLVIYTPVVHVPVPQVPFVPLPPDTPVIEVPILPPEEYLPPVVRETPKKVMFFIRNTSATISTQYVTWIDQLLLLLVPLLIVLLPLVKLAILTFMYRHYMSAQLFKEMLWLIGWWPKRNPEGIVVCRKDQKPVSYALVIYSGKSTSSDVVKVSLITDERGIFPTPDLPEGEYRISIHHQHYFFPTLRPTPAHLEQYTYYTGASFMVKNGADRPPFVIPVERIEKMDLTWLYQVRKALLLSPSASLPLLILSICICLAFPSIINISATVTYAILQARKKLKALNKKSIEVAVYDMTKKQVPQVIVALRKYDRAPVLVLAQTSVEGTTIMAVSPDVYTLWCIDFQHSLTEGDRKTKTTIKVDASTAYLPLILK